MTFDDLRAFVSALESQRVDFDGVTACVATPAALYRMKIDTVRELDRRDALALRERFDLDLD